MKETCSKGRKKRRVKEINKRSNWKKGKSKKIKGEGINDGCDRKSEKRGNLRLCK